MTIIAVTSLFVVEGAAKILETGLQLATVAGLPVNSWRAGDPTRSCYKYLAEKLGTLELTNAEYIKAGFLSTATEEWLKVLAFEVYGVEVPEATHATPTVTLENTGGGFYELEAGDLTVKNSVTGKTYHSTSGASLPPGAVEIFELVADEAGTDSSVDVDEIDEMVTVFLGVEIVSSTASTGTDEPTEAEIKALCDTSLGALSPNGPGDAYEHVVLNSDLTGVTEITRAKSGADTDTGEVTVYVGSAAGVVSGAGVTAAQNAVEEWATPLCITPTVASVAVTSINLEAEATGTDLPAGWEDVAESAVAAYLAALIGPVVVARSKLDQVIHAAVPEIESLDLIAPASNTSVLVGFVPALGTVTLTEA